jgi:type VI secretion system protein ImpA
MASPQVLDVASLLGPLSAGGGGRAGEDLRKDLSPSSVYQAIKDARHQARMLERKLDMGAADAKAPRPDWSLVLRQVPKLLATKTRDLELAAWLIEALVREHGFAGLRDGFALACGLVEQFWDDLHPLPDDEGVSTRVAALAGLNGDDAEGTLIRPIRMVPITAGSPGYSCNDYEAAAQLERIDDEKVKQRRIQQGTPTLATFEAALGSTPPHVLRELGADLAGAAEAFGRLTALLDAKCGSDAPPSSNIRNALAACAHTIASVTRDLPGMGATAGAAAGGAASAPGAAAAPGESLQSTGYANRQEALNAVLRAARYFRISEPHSPISYALEQIYGWGRKSFPDLIAELVEESSARQNLFRLVGISPDQRAKSSD